MILRFYKENKDWYVDLPEYQGDKEDLQMILGADTMLDLLSTVNKTHVTLDVKSYDDDSGIYYKGDIYILRKLVVPESVAAGGGQWYVLDMGNQYAVWLCEVTEFVFGSFPNVISIRYA